MLANNFIKLKIKILEIGLNDILLLNSEICRQNRGRSVGLKGEMAKFKNNKKIKIIPEVSQFYTE